LSAAIDGVQLEVGISQRGVVTAFPSWRQYHLTTFGEAYEQWCDDYIRLAELLSAARTGRRAGRSLSTSLRSSISTWRCNVPLTSVATCTF
jgi:hypothetical protein